MLASSILKRTRRTTVSADQDALATLQAEAGRRGVPLNVVLGEAVEEKAASVRRARRPRVGIGRSTDGQAAADLAAEPIARPPS